MPRLDPKWLLDRVKARAELRSHRRSPPLPSTPASLPPQAQKPRPAAR